MIAFTLEPDALSMTGNMKKYKISGAQADVTMTLSLGNSVSNDPLLVRIYSPDADGHIEVDLKEIVESYLETSLQDADEPYQQTSLVRVFTTQFSTTPPGASSAETLTDTFTAIRAGVDKLSDTPYNFLRQNFLTWQPNVKGVTYSTPEFLTYYNADQAYDVVVKCGEITKNPTTGYDIRKGVPMSDGTQSQTPITLKTIPAGQAWTIPVQYAVIAGLTEGLPKYYDVWVETSLGARLTYVQRYFAQDMKSEQEEWVLFVNSLGGIDTFRAYGESALTAKHTHNVAEIEEVSEEYRVDTERTYKKNTGRLSWKERIWLLDFFPARQKYLYYGQAVRRIVVTESEASYKASELPSAYTFTYRYAEAKPYLNIPRVDVPLDVLSIEVPEVGSFTVAPRLVEFPRTSLSSGALFPVQDPYSEDWGTTTLGAILEAVGAAGLADAASKEWVVGVINTALDEYYNKTASDARYVQTGWFDELFQLYSGNTKQDVNGQLPVDRSQLNIKSMFGFWTEKYISALGRNDDQGGGSVQALGDLSDVALTQSSYGEGQVLKLHYDSVSGEWKWVNDDDAGGVDMSVVWAALATNDNTHIINASHLPIATASALGVVKVGTTLSVDQYGLLNLPTFGTAGTYFKVTVDQYGRVSTGVASLEAADIPSLDAAKITTGTFDVARIPNIENLNHFSTKVYDASATRTANYVLAAPNGSNGAAVFRALVAADIPNLSWNKITSDKPDKLSGYGITDAKIENGVITLGNATITPITSVAMTVPTGFSITGTPISKTGTLALSYASGYEGFTTELKNKINLLYSLFTREGSGTSADPYIIKANYGLYTEQFLSALGLNGQQGGGSVQALGDLSNVTLTNPQSGQVLKYNGSVWVNANDEGSSTLAWSQITGKPTTISGYGITDAYISNGTIYLGSVSITPLTSFTETDPTVPAWAKAVSKPTYNLDEVLDGNTRKLADYLNKTNGGTISGDVTFYGAKFIQQYEFNPSDPETAYLVIENGIITLDHGGKIQTNNESYYFADNGSAVLSSLTIGGYTAATQNWADNRFLPLSAGSTKSLTGDLYLGQNSNSRHAILNVSYLDASNYIQIGNIKIVYDNTNGINALKIVDATNANTAASIYATGGVSALGYSAGGSGGGGGATHLDDLEDVVLTNRTAGDILRYDGSNWVNVTLGTAMANYATQAWVNTQLGDYLLKSGGTMNGILTNTMWIEVVDNSYHYDTFIQAGELRVSKGTGLETSIDGGTVTANSFVKRNGTSSQFLKADGSVDSSTYLTSVAFSNLTSHPTTISGYGITDAKIENGTITLGSATITPLTSSVLSGYLPLSGDTMAGNIYFPADYGVVFDTDSSIKVSDSDSFLHINGYLAIVFGINDGTNVTERMRLTASGLQVINGLGVGTAPTNGYAIDADGAIRGTSMYINTNAVRHAGDTYISSGTIYIGGSSITPLTSSALSSYLPLTAGSGNALTGTLYANSGITIMANTTTVGLELQKTGGIKMRYIDGSSHVLLYNDGNVLKINKNVGTSSVSTATIIDSSNWGSYIGTNDNHVGYADHAGEAGYATSAGSAAQDGNGNTISSTYLPLQVSSKPILTASQADWGWCFQNKQNSSVTSELYIAHPQGNGMHLRGYSTSSSIYLLQVYNNTEEKFGVYADGRTYIKGKVGIGTATPTHNFNVYGTPSGGWLSLINTDNSGVWMAHSAGYGLAVESTSDNASYYLLKLASGVSSIGGSGGTIRFIVNNDGKVGIGTSAPTTLLDVNGTCKASNVTLTGTDAMYFTNVGSGMYDICAFFVETTGVIFELPRKTDSRSGEVVPLYIRARGGQAADINAKGFIKANSSSAYVLTGDGGHAAISGLSVSYATSAGSAPASDVYSWAKASTKPSYNLDEVSDGSTRNLSNYLPLIGDTMTGSIDFPADKGVRFDTDSSIKVDDSDSFLHINGYLAIVFGINDGTNVTERMRLTASGLQVINGLGVGTAPANGYAIDADGAIRGTSMYINTNAVRHAGDTYISSGTIYIGGSSITPITSQYSLPLAANGTRGGVQIGFTTSAANRNYAVQLSSEKMYVNVPWENTTYSQGTGISISGTTIAITSAYQTNISHGETAYGWGNHATAGYASASALSGYLPLTAGSGNELTGHLYLHESLRMRYVDGSSYIGLFNDGNVLKMTKNVGGSSASTVTIIDSSNWGSYIGTNANHVGYADHAGEAGYATSAGTATDSTKVLKAGDTMTGNLSISKSSAKLTVTDGTKGMSLGLWDGTTNRIETLGAPLKITIYGSYGLNIGRNGGGDDFVIDSSGKVGIGTTSPEFNFHVYGTPTNSWLSRVNTTHSGVWMAHDGGYGLAVESTSTGSSCYLLKLASGVSSIGGSGGTIRFIVNNDGKVGIGTSSPTEKLDVVGNLRVRGTASFQSDAFFNTTPSLGTMSGTVAFYGTYNNDKTKYGLFYWNEAWSGTASLQSAYNDGGTTPLPLSLQPLGGNVGIGYTGVSTAQKPSYNLDVNGNARVTTSAYFCTSSGNVGIGTNSPSSKLHVAGDIYATTSISGYALGVNQTGGEGCGISLYNGSAGGNAPAYGLMFAQTTYFGTLGSVSGDWATYFTMNRTSNRGWIFRRDSTNVCSIGNDYGSIYTKGHVKAEYGFYATKENSSHYCSIINNGSGTFIDSQDGNNINTSIEITADDVDFFTDGYVYGDFQSTSDIRMKNVLSYDVLPNFEAVANAPAIRFRWNQLSRSRNYDLHLGSIAQYWQNILPETVTTDKQGYLSMSYDVIALLAAISVAKRVTEHERRIESLERENAMLRMEINSLKAA